MSPHVMEVAIQPPLWLRDPAARLEQDSIVVDHEKLETYDPMAKRALPYDLAGVRTPSDALDFVQEYGLLTYEDRNHQRINRLPFEEFDYAARWVRDILQAYEDLRIAVNGGSAGRAATERLRTFYNGAPHPMSYYFRATLGPEEIPPFYPKYEHDTHQEFLTRVSRWIDRALTFTKWDAKLETITPEDAVPGDFKRVIRPGQSRASLVETGVFFIEEDILGKVSLKRCRGYPFCTAYVRDSDGRGRKPLWHSKACAERNRKRAKRAAEKERANHLQHSAGGQ